jgi:hypothetical protein
LDADVRVGDVGDVACGVVVGFDAAAVLRVADCGVGELSFIELASLHLASQEYCA